MHLQVVQQTLDLFILFGFQPLFLKWLGCVPWYPYKGERLDVRLDPHALAMCFFLLDPRDPWRSPDNGCFRGWRRGVARAVTGEGSGGGAGAVLLLRKDRSTQ